MMFNKAQAVHKERLLGPPSKPIDKQALGIRIKDARETNDITQEALAARLGTTAQMLDKWESGCEFPPLDTVNQIADELDLNRAVLLGVENGFTIRVLRDNTYQATLAGVIMIILDYYTTINGIVLINAVFDRIFDFIAICCLTGPFIYYRNWNKKWRADRTEQ